MRAYSTDLRERIVRAVESGRPHREAARTFGVAACTVKRYLQRQEQTGSLARTPIVGGPRSIRAEQEAALVAQVSAHPAATLAEHCAWWEQAQGQTLSVATMWRALRRLGWTRKKRRWQPASATRRSGRPGVR